MQRRVVLPGLLEFFHEMFGPHGRYGVTARTYTSPLGTVFFGTSNAYTPPAHAHTDAVLALNIIARVDNAPPKHFLSAAIALPDPGSRTVKVRN